MLRKIRDRYETWKTENYVSDEDVIIVAVGVAVLTSITGLAIAAARQEYKKAEADSEWIASEIESGRQVYQMHDGSYISTDSARIRW